MSTSNLPRGPGLFEVGRANGERMITNVRRIAGADRAPGSALVSAATILLGLLAAGLFVVSLTAQYRYVFAVKHQSVPSAIEAVGLDVGMAVFSLLALGLAMAGQSARIERALIVVCAVASAGQNYAAADVTSPRSVAAYVVPPLFLALVVNRVVAVVRRHVLGDAERSVWAAVGRGLAAALEGLGLGVLYLLRLVLAPPSTSAGLRRLVLIAAPLPAAEKRERGTAMRTRTTGPSRPSWRARASAPGWRGGTSGMPLTGTGRRSPRRLSGWPRWSVSARAPPGRTSGRSSPAWRRTARRHDAVRRPRPGGDPGRPLRALHGVLR